MKKHCKRLSLCVIILISLLLFAGVAAAEGKWMIARNTLSTGEGRPVGQPTEDSVCIWDPSYREGETVEWFGGRKYSQSLGGFAAHGEGRAVWYLNGAFEQSDEGKHLMGKRHGQIIQRYADGRTVVAIWEYGEKQVKEPDSITRIYKYNLITDIYKYKIDQVEQYPLGYSGKLTPQRLMEGLSSLLGEPININSIKVTDKRIVVDLSSASAPIRPPADQSTYPDQLDYEENILNSIARTVRENFGDKDIYFSVDGKSYQAKSCMLAVDAPFVNIELKQAHWGMAHD